MTDNDFIIRKATLSDCEAIGHIHTISWQQSYKGIIPQDYLDNLSEAERATQCYKIMSSPESDSLYLVAEQNGTIIGFGVFGPLRYSETEEEETELYAIYLLDEVKGTGIGVALAQAIAQELISQNYNSMMLWVLKDNPRAIKFYERLGGVKGRSEISDIGGKDLEEIAYIWKDLKNSPLNKEAISS